MEERSINMQSLLSRIQEQENKKIQLKKLYQRMKDQSKNYQRLNDNSNCQDQSDLKKKLRNTEVEVDHKTLLLNILIQSNNKCKAQVNSLRNSRVIYSNIYKQLQKNILKHQHQLKIELIEGILLDSTNQILLSKAKKSNNKWQKKISKLKLQLQEAIKGKQNMQIKQNKPKENLEKTGNTFHLKSKRTRKAVVYDKQSNEKQQKMQKTLEELKKLTNLTNLNSILQFSREIDLKNQQEYKQYLKLEKKTNQLEDQIKKITHCIQELDNQQGNEGEQEENKDLNSLRQEIKKQEDQLAKLEQQADKCLDINTKYLNSQDIRYHFYRFKEQKQKMNPKNLEKVLQATFKNKSDESCILSQQQMKKNYMQTLN